MHQKDDYKTVGIAFFQFFVGALFSYAAFELFIFSAQHPIEEESWVEVGQEILLAASAALFLWRAPQHKSVEGGLWLIGGFFVTLLLREFDSWLGLLFHGSWKYFVLVWLLILFTVIVRRGAVKTMIPGLVDVIRHRAYWLLLAGTVLLLVYSRLFGMKCVWEIYAAGDCANWRTIKSFSEEAAELLAYMLIFWGSCIYCFDLWRRKES